MVLTNRETAIQGHLRSSVADRGGIYDYYLLSLNGNFNRSWDITSSFHIRTHLSSRWNWKKDGYE